MGKLFSKRKNTRQNIAGHGHKMNSAHEQTKASRMDCSDVTPFLKTNTGPVHTDAVVSLAKVQPGLCLSGSKDKSVALYDYHNHRLEDKWTGHERDITKVCYGIHCRGIFSASRDQTIKLWYRGNANSFRDYIGHELVVSALHINNDNSCLCSGSRDNTVKLWDVETGECIRENRLSRNLVTDVKFVGDTHMVVQTGEDKEVRLFDTRTMSIAHNFPRKQYIQMCCDVSPDGNYCVTCSNGFGGNGCEATLWDLRTLQIVHEFKGHTEAVESCIFLPNQDRSLIATSSRDCTVKIWDQFSKEVVAQCIISCSGPLTSLIAYEDKSLCVSSFNEGIHELRLSVINKTLTQRFRY